MDFNLSGLSAVLAHPLTGQSYPIYWQPHIPDVAPDAASSEHEPQRYWQLPAIAHLPRNFSKDEAHCPIQLPIPGVPASEGLLVRDLSTLLSAGLPYHSQQVWKPKFNGYFEAAQPQHSLPETDPISLHLLTRVLKQLLSTFHPQPEALNNQQAPTDPGWGCSAEGLDRDRFQKIMADLEGVIINSSTDHNEAYHFNVREAVLGAGLVQRPEQVAFIEESIATLLAEFPPNSGFNTNDWQGATLVIHAGEATTDLALTCLPSGLHNLTRTDIKLRQFEYGEQAFQQDIACQLLTPFIPEDQLGLDLAILPIPGEPDSTVRGQLQRQLYRSTTGKMFLEASAYLQQALQQQERMTFEFGPYACTFSQTAMDTKVVQPLALRLGREMHRLLQENDLTEQDIRQVVYSGSADLINALRPWLQKTLPQAEVRERSSSAHQPSRIAQGLAQLPLYTQTLDRSGQQYSDYFLLTEMLRSLPAEALTTQEIFSHLEAQGINTQSCQVRILNLLNGQIPAGLVPHPTDVWTPSTNNMAEYPEIQLKPLFRKFSSQSFQIDPEQRRHFLDYWQRITQDTHQTLAEPCILELGIEV